MTITFPTGQTLHLGGLTQSQMSDVMQQVTCFVFGITNKLPFDVALTQGSANVTLDNVTSVNIGFLITGAGIAENTTVQNIEGNSIVLSIPALATGNATILVSDPLAGIKVRQSWPVDGAPAYGITDNVSFIRCSEVDNYYNKNQDHNVIEMDAASATDNIEQTRVWRVFWELRGPTSYDRASLLKTAMQLDFIRATLQPVNLYIVADVGSPRRAPELKDGRWWERTDIAMEFYEQVNSSVVLPTVASVPFQIG